MTAANPTLTALVAEQRVRTSERAVVREEDGRTVCLAATRRVATGTGCLVLRSEEWDWVALRTVGAVRAKHVQHVRAASLLERTERGHGHVADPAAVHPLPTSRRRASPLVQRS
eukprot:scaffold131022_cov51-Phaeocystis_antarctica.AAC.4